MGDPAAEEVADPEVEPRRYADEAVLVVEFKHFEPAVDVVHLAVAAKRLGDRQIHVEGGVALPEAHQGEVGLGAGDHIGPECEGRAQRRVGVHRRPHAERPGVGVQLRVVGHVPAGADDRTHRAADVPVAAQDCHHAIREHAPTGGDDHLVEMVEMAGGGQVFGEVPHPAQELVDLAEVIAPEVEDALVALDARQPDPVGGADSLGHPHRPLERPAPGPARHHAQLHESVDRPARRATGQRRLHEFHARDRVDQAEQFDLGVGVEFVGHPNDGRRIHHLVGDEDPGDVEGPEDAGLAGRGDGDGPRPRFELEV